MKGQYRTLLYNCRKIVEQCNAVTRNTRDPENHEGSEFIRSHVSNIGAQENRNLSFGEGNRAKQLWGASGLACFDMNLPVGEIHCILPRLQEYHME